MNTNHSKHVLIGLTVAVLVVGAFLVGDERHVETQKTITIGALLPLSGGLASYGEPALKMMSMAAEEINSLGGINGQKLVLNIQDHKCDPKTALSEFTQLTTTRGINLFASLACSGTALAIAPELVSKRAILVGTITTTPKLTGVSPNFFRNWSSDKSEAILFADMLIKKKVKSVAVLYEETDYAKGLKIALEELLAPEGVSVISESFVTGATDVRTQLVKVRAENADAFFLSPQTITSGEIVLSQMEALRFKPALFVVNDNVLKSIELRSKHVDLLEGAIGADFVMNPTDKGVNALARFREVYGKDCEPENVCLGAYDAIGLLAKATMSGNDISVIRNTLKNSAYEGASGVISFGGNNDRENTGYKLFVIRNGEPLSVVDIK